MDKFRSVNVPIGDVQVPVLTIEKIPGRAPWLASRLRVIAERIDGWADRLDDRYELPASPPSYDSTVTFSNRWVFGDSERADA